MNLSRELNVIIDVLFVWFPLTSLTNIAAISLDRMHATILPFRHRLIKKWVYGVTIACVWVLAAMEVLRLEFSLIILHFMNSLVNPIVYTIRIPEFRKALLLLFKRQRGQNARDIPLHAL
ncbi:uncharacterized protein [Porites lutea]|uniref:uncharacterized protein n=1 Tax=Porites lutea TaxID=51062 RepID=UPI003CC58D8A